MPNSSHDEIYLETDEEVTSAIDKIKKSKKKNLALVLPRSAVLGQSIVNLKLVHKQATAEGKNVAIITNDKVASSLAERVGFITAESAGEIIFPKHDDEKEASDSKKESENKDKEAEVPTAPLTRQRFDAKTAAAVGGDETDPDPMPEPTTDSEEATLSPDDTTVDTTIEDKPTSPEPSPLSRGMGSMIPSRGNLRMYRQQKRRPLLIPLAILLALLLVGGVSAALVVPTAAVTITVKAQPFNETLSSIVDTEATAINPETATVPGKLMSQEETTKSSTKATGKKDVGTKASGTVIISNSWDSLPHTYTVGTRVRSKSGAEFALTTETTVPGATSTISSGVSVITPGKKAADVEAVLPGDGYNLAPTTFTLPDLPKAQQEKITASSDTTFTGGASKIVSVVTQADIDSLVQTLKVKNKDDALAKLKVQAGNTIVLDKAIQTLAQDVSSVAAVDTVAENVEATIVGKFQVITFTNVDQTTLLKQLLANKIPQGQNLVTEGEGVALDTSQFDINLVSEKKLELTNNLKAFTVTQFDQGAIHRSLIGIAPKDVEKTIKEKLDIQNVETQVTPSSWPRLPFLGSKIKVTYTYTGKDT